MQNKHKTAIPPRWANRFLEWYCRAELLEEIQGDLFELYFRTVKTNPRHANIAFCWNVLRFFRWKNIKNSRQLISYSDFSFAMFKNILLVSFRNFIRQPAHTTLNVIGLSIGFAAAILVTLWLNHEFSYDRFHNDEHQLYRIISHVQSDGSVQTFDAASAGIDLSTVPEVEKLVTVSEGTRWPHALCFRPEQKPDECIYLTGVYSNENFFTVFNFPIIEGDTNPINKEKRNIAVSQSMARNLFGNESAIGKTIMIDGFLPVTIGSVFKDTPGNSSLTFDFVMPFSVLKTLWGTNDEAFNGNFFPTYVKTHPRVSKEVLTEKLNSPAVLTDDLRTHKVKYEAYQFTDWRLFSKFENGANVGGRIEYIKLFIIIGVLVLVLAIINYINLSTARATTRSKEIGIRKVTGALKHSIIIQFMTESLLLVITAFLVAVLIAQTFLPFFSQLTGENLSGFTNINSLTSIQILIILVVVSIAAGLYPAFVMSAFQPVKILKKQINLKGTGSDRLRKTLLLVQLTVALGIINFSGVMYYQMKFIRNQNLGFEHSNTLRIEPTATIFKKFDVFKNELKKDPAIISAATSNLNPLGTEGYNTAVKWPGKPDATQLTFQTIGCSYEFPETIGLKIIQGRNFSEKPLDSLNTEVLLSEDAVKAMGLKNPIGEIIEIYGRPFNVIGIINNFHTESFHQKRLPVILYRANYMQTAAVYVRYQPGTTEKALATVSSAYKSIEPSFTMRYWFQDEAFDNLYKTERTASQLLLVFTLISIGVALIGIVGLSTFNVVRKTKEIGIRRVFGASKSQVITLLSGEFSAIMILALLLATPLAWYASSEWLSGFVYHAQLPWWMFLITFIGMAIITLGIISFQGMKTLSNNPTETLRIE